MSGGLSDPTFDGGVLVYPQIQSPDYVPGVSGWALLSDGTAELGAAVIRGDVDGTGALQSPDYVPGVSGWAVKADGTAELAGASIRGPVGSVDGTGSLRSINYVAGSAGWSIKSDGSAELNNATIRGTLIAGNTRVDSTGIRTTLTNGSWVVDSTGTTLAASDGSYIKHTATSSGAATSYRPYNLATPQVTDGQISTTWGGNLETYGVLSLTTPTLLGKQPARIDLYGEPDQSNAQSSALYSPGGFRFDGGPVIDRGNLPLLVGQTGRELISFTSLAQFSKPVTFTTPFPTGVIPDVQVNIAAAGSETTRWNARGISISNTGFTVFVYRGDAADPVQTWANVPVTWSAAAPANS